MKKYIYVITYSHNHGTTIYLYFSDKMMSHAKLIAIAKQRIKIERGEKFDPTDEFLEVIRQDVKDIPVL